MPDAAGDTDDSTNQPTAAGALAAESERIPGVERLGVAIGIAWVVVCAAGIALHQPGERISFACFSVAAVGWAWLVWRFGLIGYSFWKTSDSATGASREEVKTVECPLPRGLAVAMLALAAVVLAVAATPTGIGTVVAVPVRATIAAGTFVNSSWQLLANVLALGSSCGPSFPSSSCPMSLMTDGWAWDV